MYELFTEKYTSNNSVLSLPEFDLIKRTFQSDIERIRLYYQNRPMRVKSNHFLCRLLNLFNIPFNYPLDKFMDLMYARAPYISKVFEITSPINYGEIHNGLFYGENIKEIYIYDDSYFDPYEEIKNWKNIEAIKVIDHPVSNINLLIPNGEINSTEEGYAFILINVGKLMLQYRGFILEQKNNLDNGNNSLLSVSHFIRMYVLPSMLKSHTDIVIFNRLLNLYYGAPMGEANKKYVFYIHNYSFKIDKALKNVIYRLRSVSLDYRGALKNIPSIYNEDFQEFSLMPDITRTRQVWWSLLISRLKIVKFLIDIGGERDILRNRSFINKFKIDYKRIHYDKALEQRLPSNMYYDFKEIIDEIMKV